MALRYGAGTKRPSLPRRAVPYQDKNDPSRKLVDASQPEVAAALSRAVKNFRATIPAEAIATKIGARDFTGAADLVNISTLEHDLKGAFDAIAGVYKASADRAAGSANALRAASRKVTKDATTFGGQDETPDNYSFDLYTEDVVQELRALQDELIGGMTDDMRKRVFDDILAGMRANLPPEEIARDIKQDCGLSVRMAKAIRSYRKALESGDAEVLTRALRDAGADAEVRDALQSGVALSNDRVDSLVLAYANRALDYRAKMIAQTETTRAATLGLQASYAQAIENGLFPAAAVRQHWMLALDEKTCLRCIMYAVAANAGIPIGAAFQSDDGEISGPPVHPNCLPGDTMVAAKGVTAASKRWYDGNLIVIRTASGKNISCTPNHPILTHRGWVAAHLVNKGDNLVCRRAGEKIASLIGPDGDDVPARIEDIAKALRCSKEVVSRPVPVASEDFHGDGTGSKIAIIYSNRLLRNRLDSATTKLKLQLDLVFRNVELSLLDRLGSLLFLFQGVNATDGCFMCGGALALSRLSVHKGPLQTLSLALRSYMDTRLQQPGADSVPADAEDTRNMILRDPLLIEFDAIASCDVKPFSGHVFNLETVDGYYVANQIYTHNCRCSIEIRTDLDMLP